MDRKKITLLQRACRYEKVHRAACEEWNNGESQHIGLDDEGNVCIRYENGRWYHYSEENGEVIWW